MKYLVALIIIFNSIVLAQPLKISGRVLDSSILKPLEFANIVIADSKKGTTCDRNGAFAIEVDPSSGGHLIVSHIGYEAKLISFGSLKAGEQLQILLEQKPIPSQTILVEAMLTKNQNAPLSYSTLEKSEIQKEYSVQDIPQFLSGIPSVTSYSENGNGIGYNYLNIRGFDQRRISVAVNGIPQNDPEDHNVYWLDFPDILASSELIQVQRGAGSGITGYPSIGGSLNIITSSFSGNPDYSFSASAGSYNTRKYSVSCASGLIDGKYSVYAKLSRIMSSGYRQKSWSDFKAYHLSFVRYDNDLTTQLNLYGGPVTDGLAYTGLPKFAIKDREMRKQNYSDWDASGDKYSYYVERRPEEIENFSQPHFELLNEFTINEKIKFNSALFLITGTGFYDYDASWADTSYFRLTRENGFNPSSNPSNALIRAQVENKQYGWIPRLSIRHKGGDLTIGGEVRFHKSLHWGSISYAGSLPEGAGKEYRYYEYNGKKDIFNFFANENLDLSGGLTLLIETQLAYHKYRLYNEKYAGYDFTVDGLFFNPRIGLNYKLSGTVNAYCSFAKVSREPRLKNYYDAAESSGGETPQFEQSENGKYDFSSPLVKPETMNDVEAGVGYLNDALTLGVNGYLMIFKNEIVKNGQTDRFGQPVTGNMNKTLHMGLEISAEYKIGSDAEVIFNSTVSSNKIHEGTVYLKHGKYFDLKDNQLGGFPSLLMNAVFRYHRQGAFISVTARYVGNSYSDNYAGNLAGYLAANPGFVSYSDNKVDPYFTMDVFGSYEFADIPRLEGNVRFFIQVVNLFDRLYAAQAVGKEFFPAAERNFVAGIRLGL